MRIIKTTVIPKLVEKSVRKTFGWLRNPAATGLSNPIKNGMFTGGFLPFSVVSSTY
jgi:hypothetical protein